MVLEKTKTCIIHVKAFNDYTEFKLFQTEHINTATVNDNFLVYFTNTINKGLNKNVVLTYKTHIFKFLGFHCGAADVSILLVYDTVPHLR
jgi:hypothetical protein